MAAAGSRHRHHTQALTAPWSTTIRQESRHHSRGRETALQLLLQRSHCLGHHLEASARAKIVCCHLRQRSIKMRRPSLCKRWMRQSVGQAGTLTCQFHRSSEHRFLLLLTSHHGWTTISSTNSSLRALGSLSITRHRQSFSRQETADSRTKPLHVVRLLPTFRQPDTTHSLTTLTRWWINASLARLSRYHQYCLLSKYTRLKARLPHFGPRLRGVGRNSRICQTGKMRTHGR